STGRRPRGRALLLFDLLRNLDDLPPAVVAVRGHVVTPVRLARRLVDGEGGPAKGIMGTTHATPRRRLARFLHSHFQVLPIRTNRSVTRQPPASRRQPRSSLTIPAEGVSHSSGRSCRGTMGREIISSSSIRIAGMIRS